MAEEQYTIISGPIRTDGKISFAAKFLYGEIVYKAKLKGYAWSSNEAFAEVMKIDNRSIRRMLKELSDAGYILIEGATKARKIFVVSGVETTDKSVLSEGLITDNFVPNPLSIADKSVPNEEATTDKSVLDYGQICPQKNNIKEYSEYNDDVDTTGVVKKLQPVKSNLEISLFPTDQPAASPNNEPHPPNGGAPPAPAGPEDENSPYWLEQLTAFEGNEFIIDEVGVSRHLPKEAVVVLRRRFIADKRIEGIVKPSLELRRNFLRWVDKGLRDGYIERSTGILKIELQQKDEQQTTAFTRGKSLIEQQNDAFLNDFDQHGLHARPAKGA
jgi:Helix-turn-helix domain